MDGKHRIEKVSESDAMCLGNKAEKIPVSVKTPGPTRREDFEPRLVVPIQDLLAKTACGIAIDQRQDIRTMPLGIDNDHRGVRSNSFHCGVRLELFKLHQERASMRLVASMIILLLIASRFSAVA